MQIETQISFKKTILGAVHSFSSQTLSLLLIIHSDLFVVTFTDHSQ